MAGLSLAARVRAADDLGWSVHEIAEHYKMSPRYVRRILWEKDNREHRRAWDKERKRKLYMDPHVRELKAKAMRILRRRFKDIQV